LTPDRNEPFHSPLITRLRARSPLNSPKFWRWGAIVVALAFVFDAMRDTGRVWADAKPQANAKATAEKSHEDSAGGHSDPVAPVLLDILLILFFAKVAGHLFEQYGMPAVLGELAVGIVLGNLSLVGIDVMDQYFKLPDFQSQEFIRQFIADPQHVAYTPSIIIKILAGIGVILLLFEVGLESTVRQMMSVGTSSLLVAALGVIAPMALGWLVGWLLIPVEDPETDWQVHAFVGATLCATSVGITARVLKDLNQSQRAESQIILGAAVIDDVLGLVVLAVVAGVIQKGDVDFWGIAEIVGKALAFLFGAIFLGTLIVARPLFRTASYLRGHGLLVATALVICFGFSWLANFVGLAPIVGAFAAGLILEKTHYRELGQKEDHTLEEALAPLAAMLVPIFFVQMGTQVDLKSFADTRVWLLAGALTVVAIIGKQVCALGVLEKGRNRLAVGLGMIPRGEVGLIFAGVGKELRVHGEPVISNSTFSAVVVMVMITTMVTPPLLKWSLLRDEGEPPGEPGA
jgi:Kef-type K+ transport system membrane component KefB